jgi:RNA recognition motif-containing protein
VLAESEKRNQCVASTYTPIGIVDQQRSNNLYVASFPENWGQTELKELFSRYGNITSIAIKENKKGAKYAYVCFFPEENKEETDLDYGF